jgi:hypothetical protein
MGGVSRNASVGPRIDTRGIRGQAGRFRVVFGDWTEGCFIEETRDCATVHLLFI